MSEQFKVGEAFIGQNFIRDVEYNGLEGVVVEIHSGTLKMCTGGIFRGTYYRTLWANGHREYHPARNLRKKRPPSREIDTVVAWADCAWKPQGVTA